MRTLIATAALVVLPALRLSAAETAWPVPDWQTATPESQNISAAGLDKVRDWLKDHGSRTGLVVRHGRIVGEWYFGDARPDSQYIVYSTTKSLASTAAGVAIADGKFTLDTKIGDLVSDMAPEEKKSVTIRQLLAMTSGVHNESTLHSKDDVFTYALRSAPMAHRPGERWDYNNTGLALLTPVFRQATGAPIDEFLSRRVFNPIGIAASDWSWEQREGQPLSYSGLHITARALARFGLLVLNGGKWQDQQVLPKGWIAAAAGPSQELNKSYGYLWWNNTTGKWPGLPADAFAALGRFDNNLLLVPSLDLIVIRQIGDDPEPARKIDSSELFRLAVESVTDEKPAGK